MLVDMSNSVQASLSTVQAAVAQFIDTVSTRLTSASVEIGVFGFDGKEKMENLLGTNSDFSTDLAVASSTISQATLKNRDPSTNLYGAVVEGLGKFDNSRSQVNYMLVFTDGTDQAGYYKKAEADNKAASSKATTFVVATEGENNRAAVADIATGGLIVLPDISQLSDKFMQAAGTIGLISGNVYVFLYCSPRRRGSTTVTLHFDGKPINQGITVDASSFGSSGNELCDQVRTSVYTYT